MDVVKMFEEASPPIKVCVVGCGGAGINALREIKIETPRINKVAINLSPGGSLLSALAQHRIFLSEEHIEHYTREDVYHLTIANYKRISEAIGSPDLLVVITALNGRTGIGVAKALNEMYEDILVILVCFAPFAFEKNFDIVYITNNSFPLKSYLDKCSAGDINCISDLCRKNLQEYCKIVCLIFYKKSWSNNYEVKEINGSIGTIINAGALSVAEVLPFKVYLINEPKKSEIPIYFWIIVAVIVVISLYFLFRYLRIWI